MQTMSPRATSQILGEIPETIVAHDTHDSTGRMAKIRLHRKLAR
jgi:hypothetical protein